MKVKLTLARPGSSTVDLTVTAEPTTSIGNIAPELANADRDELLDRLSALGFSVPRNRPRVQTARSVRSQLPASADRTSIVTSAGDIDRSVFGGEDLPDDIVDEAWANTDPELASAAAEVPAWQRRLERFRIRSKRGLPAALTSIHTTAVTDRVKELVNR